MPLNRIFVRRISLALALAGLPLPVQAHRQEGQARPPVQADRAESPREFGSEAAALGEWLAAYNQNDPASFERFARTGYSSKELAERDAATIAAGIRVWFHNYGPMRLVGAPTVKAGEAEAVVYLPSVDACARLWVERNAEERKIGGVYLEPFARVKCGERHIRATSFANLATMLRRYVDELAKQGRFSGVVLVMHRDKPLLEEARGLARTAREANKLDTRFELASGAKMFTAVAIARLVERGRLSYDDKLGDVLPDFHGVPDSRAITVRQLLSHSSGLEDYYRNGQIFKDPRHRTRLQEFWPLFASAPLEFKPGSRYGYSNSNYVLLGSIVERLAGMPFQRFVQQEIFNRAGMRSSCYCTPAPTVSAQPRSMYTSGAGPNRRPLREGWVEVPDNRPLHAAPAGHAMSTAIDLGRFGRALLGGALLTPATRDKMFRPLLAMDDGGYASLGFETYPVADSRVVGHSGFSWGVRHQTDIYPREELIVTVLSNSDASGLEAIRHKARQWIAALTMRTKPKTRPAR